MERTRRVAGKVQSGKGEGVERDANHLDESCDAHAEVI